MDSVQNENSDDIGAVQEPGLVGIPHRITDVEIEAKRVELHQWVFCFPRVMPVQKDQEMASKGSEATVGSQLRKQE